jgi:hexosaminidase
MPNQKYFSMLYNSASVTIQIIPIFGRYCKVRIHDCRTLPADKIDIRREQINIADIMKYIFSLLLIISILFFNMLPARSQERQSPLIPLPQKMEQEKGAFRFGPSTRLQIISPNENTGGMDGFFSELIFGDLNFRPEILQGPSGRIKRNTVVFVLDKGISGGEEYHVSITKRAIKISAGTTTGLFYGLQTLRQLMASETAIKDGSSVKLPCVEIEDAPRFAYRGIMLDVARHFFPKEAIFKYIELLSFYKFNHLHLHLTDDQGWRLEIKKYPELTQIGSVREETLVGHMRDKPQKFDGKKYGGFYTQEDMKEIIARAQKFHITIVPEIEMPGHSQAVLTSYPELGCTGGPYKVRNIWGISDDVLCAGNENTYTFLENVLAEVADLFPGEFIHVGGDECPKVRWKTCPKCQAMIQKENLKDEHELQSYLIKRASLFLKEKGKKLLGWDEILEGGLAPDAAVMSWRGIKGGIEAAKMGHTVVMSPTTFCYLDYCQSANKANEPLSIGGFLPLSKVYSFDPVPADFTKEEAAFVIGGQGNLWTEYIDNESSLEYMLFPRALALSEVFWTPNERKDFVGFQKRVKMQFPILKNKNVNFRESAEFE